MAELTKLPNITKLTERWLLLRKIRNIVDKETVMGSAIINAIDNKVTPIDDILTFIKSQAGDSPSTMTRIIGEDLTNQILKLEI